MGHCNYQPRRSINNVYKGLRAMPISVIVEMSYWKVNEWQVARLQLAIWREISGHPIAHDVFEQMQKNKENQVSIKLFFSIAVKGYLQWKQVYGVEVDVATIVRRLLCTMNQGSVHVKNIKTRGYPVHMQWQ
ncbi:unnamed protein product [Linum trigynum]|uniref:Uncharacterized protein n=1 Tax=Linum trigynum TaxID=586398 RepID=A0AAV2EF51_9ROSI